MKNIISLLALFLSFFISRGQNLVPNAGFEIYSATNDTANINSVLSQNSTTSFSIANYHLCYDWFGRYCIDWEGGRGTLRNRCWDSLRYKIGIQFETLCYENAYDTANLTHTGMSCANLLIKDYPDPSSYISAALKDTLCKDCIYNISFYIYITRASNVIFDNIGLIFRDDIAVPYSISASDQKESAPFFLKSKLPLKQGIWQKVEYQYTAKGYESAILIGKYWSNKKIKVLKKHELNYAMSAYIDDIVIEKIATEPLIPGN